MMKDAGIGLILGTAIGVTMGFVMYLLLWLGV